MAAVVEPPPQMNGGRAPAGTVHDPTSTTMPLRLGTNKPGVTYEASDGRPAFSSEWETVALSGYRITEHLLGEPHPTGRPFRILCIGAGASGIDFLHHAVTSDSFKGLDVVVSCYEKNSDVGGTWLENRYPGCACDIPSVSYQFPWKPSTSWTHFYSGSQEIWQYMRGIVDDEKLDSYIHLNTEVTSAIWDEDASCWVVKSRSCVKEKRGNSREEKFDFLVNAAGFLNAWKWPDIPGMENFKGKLYHTASYDDSVSLKGKKVAVIGSGSSGVQTVASIYDDVSKLYHWVRSPIWVTAGYGSKFGREDGQNFAYSEEQKRAWAKDKDSYRNYQKMVERELNVRFKFILRNTQESEEALRYSYQEMARRLSYDPELVSHIIPTEFNIGCRRPTPGSGYLEALVAEKTIVYFDTLHRVTEKGFMQTADGPEEEVDVIICATGFDTSFRPRFPIIGLNGANISEMWKKHALGYISSGVADIPNYFTYFGPYGPVAQGSLLPVATAMSKNLMAIVRKIRLEHVRRLSPKRSVVEAFGEHAMTYHKRTAWTDPCRSWFKQGTMDANPIVWPGSRLHYFDVLQTPRFEDYEIEYISGNRWGWLGNGFSTKEFDGSDVTYYLDDADEESFRPTLRNGTS